MLDILHGLDHIIQAIIIECVDIRLPYERLSVRVLGCEGPEGGFPFQEPAVVPVQGRVEARVEVVTPGPNGF